MNNTKKRLALLLALLMLAAVLSGCFAKKPVEEDEDIGKVEENLPPPTPSPTPTHVVEEMVTPRPIPSDIAVITAAPSTTPNTLDPVDKPVKKVTLREFASQTLGITLNVPETWVDVSEAGDDTTVILQEPDGEVWDKTPGTLTITVMHSASNLAREDAITTLENARDSLKAEFPGIEISTRGDNNKMLGETGYYYNYRIPPTSENAFAIRGRIFAVAINRLNILMQIRMPGRWSQDYLNIFAEIRSSAKVYGAE
ncbi:MAG: hypothetical protein LBD16_06295 [Oscillospiraceae bacterium]|jgi:hypothetical protein|nr:hypothetical protein [Oscillospiraceae bacterium]